MTSWVPLIPADLPVPLGDPDAYRRFAVELSRASDDLGRVAGTLGRESVAVSGVWRSVPSSARASGRLDALADLGRTWRTRSAEAGLAVGAYAVALEAAQGAVRRANYVLAHARTRPLEPPSPTFGLTTGERRVVDDAQEHLRRLRVRDRSCTQTLDGCVGGEGRGAAAVAVRIQAADAAAGASPQVLARRAHTALDTVPPDLITLEETIRVLGRMSDDPVRAAAVLSALGADYDRLRRISGSSSDPHGPPGPRAGQAGFDAPQMRAALGALAQAAARAPTPPGQARPGQARPGQARPGQARPGQARPGQARPGQARPGQARPGQARPGQARPGHALPAPGQGRGSGPGPGPEPGRGGPTHSSPHAGLPSRPTSHPPAGPPTPVAPIAVDRRQLLSALACARAQVGHPDRFPPVAGHVADGASFSAGIWAAAGVALPDTAAGQFALGHRVGIDALRPGDLVFWTVPGAPGPGTATSGGPVVTRVAVYVGHGAVVVEPPPGQDVRLLSIDRADPTLITEVVRLTSPDL